MHKYFKNFIQIGIAIILSLVIIILTAESIPIITGFFSFVFSLIAPFIAGFVIAYLLAGLVDLLVRRLRFKRMVAVSVVFFGFLGFFSVAIISLFPILSAEVQRFIKYLPQLWEDLDIWISNFYIQYDIIPERYQMDINELGKKLIEILKFKPKIKLSSIFNAFSFLFLTPVATFYFLLEYPSIKRNVKRVLIRNKQYTAIRYLRDLDKGMGQYLKGLMVVINILMILAIILFSAIGLEYAILFGFLIGYLDIIPYFGPWIGGAPAVIFAFSKDIRLGILVLIICIALQIVESNIITPYVQGKTTQIKPLYIIIALTVFGKIFGIVGIIAAVPLLYFFILTAHYIRMFIRLKKIKRLDPNWFKQSIQTES